jgi:hypothetical protein
MAPGTHSTYLRSQAEPYFAVRGQLSGLRTSSRHGPTADRHLGTWRGITYHAAYLSHYRDPRTGRSAVPRQSARTEHSYRIPGQLGQQFTPNDGYFHCCQRDVSRRVGETIHNVPAYLQCRITGLGVADWSHNGTS